MFIVYFLLFIEHTVVLVFLVQYFGVNCDLRAHCFTQACTVSCLFCSRFCDRPCRIITIFCILPGCRTFGLWGALLAGGEVVSPSTVRATKAGHAPSSSGPSQHINKWHKWLANLHGFANILKICNQKSDRK